MSREELKSLLSDELFRSLSEQRFIWDQFHFSAVNVASSDLAKDVFIDAYKEQFGAPLSPEDVIYVNDFVAFVNYEGLNTHTNASDKYGVHNDFIDRHFRRCFNLCVNLYIEEKEPFVPRAGFVCDECGKMAPVFHRRSLRGKDLDICKTCFSTLPESKQRNYTGVQPELFEWYGRTDESENCLSLFPVLPIYDSLNVSVADLVKRECLFEDDGEKIEAGDSIYQTSLEALLMQKYSSSEEYSRAMSKMHVLSLKKDRVTISRPAHLNRVYDDEVFVFPSFNLHGTGRSNRKRITVTIKFHIRTDESEKQILKKAEDPILGEPCEDWSSMKWFGPSVENIRNGYLARENRHLPEVLETLRLTTEQEARLHACLGRFSLDLNRTN